MYDWLVRIRPFRSVQTISEPCDEGEGRKKANMAVDLVTSSGGMRCQPRRCAGEGPQRRYEMPTQALCRGRPPIPGLPRPRGRLGGRHIPSGRQSPGPGRAEERGPVVGRMKTDMQEWSKSLTCQFIYLWVAPDRHPQIISNFNIRSTTLHLKMELQSTNLT